MILSGAALSRKTRPHRSRPEYVNGEVVESITYRAPMKRAKRSPWSYSGKTIGGIPIVDVLWSEQQTCSAIPNRFHWHTGGQCRGVEDSEYWNGV